MLYRSHVSRVPCEGYTSHFKLQSQATLLLDPSSNIRMATAHKHVWDSIPLERTIPGHSLVHGQAKTSPPGPQPTASAETHESRSHHCAARFGLFRVRHLLPIHSPLLKQSRLLSLPPLSDMLKFGGLLHAPQVTILKPGQACHRYVAIAESTAPLL